MEGAMMPLDYLLGIMRDKAQDARSRLHACQSGCALLSHSP
jgi:hypothetical protein